MNAPLWSGILLLLALAGCTDSSEPAGQQGDHTPPEFEIVTTSDSFDVDGNALVDVRVLWSDDESGIDLARVEVRSIRGVNGTVTPDGNLFQVWRKGALDGGGMLLEETLEELLHPGANRLVIRVFDRAGNAATDTVQVDLPSGQLFKVMSLGSWGRPTHAVLCDDGLIYMTNSNAMVVVDPRLVQILAVVRHPYAYDNQRWVLCAPTDPQVYSSPYGHEFDRPTRSWIQGRTQPTTGMSVLAPSRRDSEIFYGAEMGTGRIAVIHRPTNTRLGFLDTPASTWGDEWVTGLAVMPNDDLMYVGRSREGGVLLIDGITGAIRERIDISEPGFPGTYQGSGTSFELSSDGHWLYAALETGQYPAVLRLDTRTNVVHQRLYILDGTPGDLALSPSERRMFVSTQDVSPDHPSTNLLVDTQLWQVVARFDRPRPAGELRVDGGIVFRPDGKLIFQGEGGNVGVYLNRE